MSISTPFAKVASIVLGVAIAVALLFVPAFKADAATVEELQAQINLLLEQISSLQAQLLTAGSGATTPTTGCYSFTRDLTTGVDGADVKALQQYLNGAGFTVWSVAGGAGSAGFETTYFGSRSKTAVSAWQAANGVSPAVGYFGPLSRAKYNSLCTTGPVVTPGPGPIVPGVAGTLSVSAGAQPTNSLAVDSGARIPFTNFTVTAGASDVTMTGVLVERTGLAQDANFSSVVLLDSNGLQVGLTKTLNASHQATVGEDVVIPAGTSRMFTVAGNMAADNSTRAGEAISITVQQINSNASSVSGTLPITGATHTVNATLAIASVSVTALSHSNVTKNIGTTGYTFSSFRLTNDSSNEKIRVNSVRWNQTGSVGSTDLENVVTVIDGTSYPAELSSDGKYYTSNLGDGVVIDKGFSKEVSVKGDVVSGSGRTAIFDIYKTTDLYIVGELYGYGVTPPAGSGTAADTNSVFTAGTPWYDGAAVTVGSGSIAVSKASSVPAQNIAENSANQILGGFEIEVKGEPVTVGSMVFHTLVTGTGDSADLTNVSLYNPDGNVVAGPVNGVAANTLTFSNSVTFPVGKGVYTLKGKMGTDAANNDTIQASTSPATDWTSVTGQTTGNTITPTPASAVTANTMTVKTANITISVLPTPIAQTIVSGGRFTFANYEFDATGSGDDIKFTSVDLAYEAVANNAATNLTACALHDGSTQLNTGSNEVNPTADGSSTTFTFDTGFVVDRSTSKTLQLQCDVAATTTTDTYRWGLDSGQTDISATGVDSGTSIDADSNGITLNDGVGQLITVNTSGTYTVANSSSPGYSVVAPGTEVTLLKLRFSATREDIDIRKVALELTSAASNTPLNLVDSKVTLWDGATQIGSAIFTNNANYATSTMMSEGTFRVPKDGYKIMTVKGTIGNITAAGPMTQSGYLLVVSYDGNAVGIGGGNYGTGASSGSTINTGTTSDISPTGVRIMAAYPVVTKLSVPSNVLRTQADYVLYRFKTEAVKDDISMYKWTFTMGSSTVSATTSLYSLYAYTNSGFTASDESFASTGLINAGQCFNGIAATTAGPTTIEIYPDATSCNGATTTYDVSPGSPRYFELRATVASVETGTGNESLTAQLDGDAAFPTGNATLMENASGADGDTNDDFIWSPLSTTTAGVNNLDWTNGYGVSGLPGTNLSPEVHTSI